MSEEAVVSNNKEIMEESNKDEIEEAKHKILEDFRAFQRGQNRQKAVYVRV